MILRILIALILILGIGFLVNKTVDIQEVFQLLKDFPKGLFVLLLVFSILILFLKAVRFYILLRHAGIPISFWDTIKVSLAGQATSTLPGGEMMRGFLIKKEVNTALSKITGPIIVQSLLELLTAAIFTALGSIFVEELRIPAVILLAIVSAIFFILIHDTIFKKIMALMPEQKHLILAKNNLIKIHQKIQDNMIQKKEASFSRVILQAIGIIAIANILGGLIIFFIASTLGAKLSMFQSVFTYASSVVIQAVGSISPGGLGFTESGMAGILVLSKVAFSKAIVIVILFRLITFVFGVVIGILFLGTFYGKSLIMKKSSK